MDFDANWALLDQEEKCKWLTQFCLGSSTSTSRTQMDANLIQSCEDAMSKDTIDLYIINCISEVSSSTYAGKSYDEARDSSIVQEFYENMLFLSAETKARCIYHAVKNEHV